MKSHEVHNSIIANQYEIDKNTVYHLCVVLHAPSVELAGFNLTTKKQRDWKTCRAMLVVLTGLPQHVFTFWGHDQSAVVRMTCGAGGGLKLLGLELMFQPGVADLGGAKRVVMSNPINFKFPPDLDCFGVMPM